MIAAHTFFAEPFVMPTLILIDGYALAYQQFHALPIEKFTTSAGEPTNATYGFARTLLDILEQRPEYIAISFDQGLSGREQVYAAYKGTREKMSSDLEVQIARIRELVRAFNIPVLEVPDTEADDVIGTAARLAEAQGVEVRILTGDRDLLQLVTDHTLAQLPARKKGDVGLQLYDKARIMEEFGVTPVQFADYKGLVGDTSDNIPGVRGIGEKTAAALLQQYGTLQAVYEHLDELKAGVKTKLIEGRESAFLSKMLATIITDLPVTLDLKQCIAHDFQRDEVAELFRILEFRRLIDRLPQSNGEKAAPRGPTLSNEEEELYALYAPLPDKPSVPGEAPAPLPATVRSLRSDETMTTHIVDTEDKLQALVRALDQAQIISFDTETTSTESLTGGLVGISLAVNEDEGYYIPVGHVRLQLESDALESLAEGQLPLQQVLDALRPALTDPRKGKIAHNAAYDWIVLGRYGIEVAPLTFDTMIAEWVLNPDSRNKGLKALAWVRLNVEMTPIDMLIGKGKTQITMAQVPIAQVAPYAAADAVLTLRLLPGLHADLEKEGLWLLYKDVEVPLIPVLACMKVIGVRLDLPYLRTLAVEFVGRLDTMRQQIYELAGQEFNLGSPKQLNEVLFTKLKLPTAGLTKTTHGFSVDAFALESLSDKSPVAARMLEWRSLEKLKSTYVDSLQLLVDENERVHTTYNQTGAVTGRLSSENPNLQNIPNRTDEGRRVRRAFIAKPGCQLLSVDYSQIELRILAHYSQDPFMLNAFESGQDIHTATASAVFSIPYNEVTKDQRYLAKRVNFGLLYGMGAFRLAKETGLPVSQATGFIKRYFERLPKIEEYLEGSKQLAMQQGYLETMFGRRREFAAFKDTGGERVSSVARARAEREAINMPVQGTNADIIKKAMNELPRRLSAAGYHAQLILQVHDELVLEVPNGEVKAVAALVQEVMSSAATLDVPLATEARVGLNWTDMVLVEEWTEPEAERMA